MASKSLTFRILATDGDALKAFGSLAKGAKRDMGKVADALDEGLTAGQKMAKGLIAAAEQIDAEYVGLRSASEKLASALGPEFAAKAEQGVDGLVLDLRRAGLTFEEIEADADGLAMAVKRLDDVQLGKMKGELGQVDDKMRQVGDTTDRSRGVMANFVGNASQDLPGVSGSMGALNVAVGQFAEYATEGDIKMKQFLKTAAGMAVAAGGAAALAYVLQGMAKEKAFESERVKSWADEVRDGKSAIEILNDEMRETERIERGTFGGAQDITRAVARVGWTMESFTAMALQGEDAWLAWAETALRSGESALDVTVIMDGLSDAFDGIADANTISAARTKVFGEKVEEAAVSVDRFGGVLERGGPVAEAFAGSLGAVATTTDDTTIALRELGIEWEKLAGTWDDEDAWLNLQTSFDDVAEKAKTTAEAMKKGGAEAEQAMRDQALAQNDLKREVVEYYQSVLDLPEEAVTNVKAMLDTLSLEQIEARLRTLTRNRNISISIQSRSGAGYSTEDQFHDGGVVGGGRIGEERPILAKVGETVLPTHKAPLSSFIGGGNSGPTVIQLVLDGRIITEVVHDGLLRKQRRVPLGIG